MKLRAYILVFLFPVFSACNVKVETVAPTREKISELVYASGNVKSKNQYEVFASANGVVTKLMVQEGDTVKKGQALLKLDNRVPTLNVESAALLAENASASQNSEKLRELTNAVELARVKLEYDSSLLARQQNLWKANIGTRNELERQELAYQNSRKAYESAQLNYADFKKQLRLQDQQAQKNVSISKSVAADYAVKSEMDGKVYDVFVSEGEMVTTQRPIAILGDVDDFILELNVDEYDVSRVRVGQRVLINMDSYKEQVFTAQVTRIAPIMNSRTKTFVVEAKFLERPKVLFPNLSCEANIIIRSNENAITIPRSYLLAGDYVLLKNNKKKKIVTGVKDYRKVEVVGGLTTSDIIRKPEE